MSVTPERSATEAFADIEHLARTTLPDLAVLVAPDVDGLAQLLVAVRRAQAQLRWAEETLEDELVKAMPGKDAEVPGVGMITLRTGTSRKAWDKDGLVDRLVAKIGDEPAFFVDEETGEFLTPSETARQVIAGFMRAATPSWKVTGLREFRIDPDEFCETTWGRKSIQTPPIDDPFGASK